MEMDKFYSNAELRRAAYRAIARELGPSGLIRFIQDRSNGSGDYTRDRHTWLPKKSVEELASDIRAWRQEKKDSAERPPG